MRLNAPTALRQLFVAAVLGDDDGALAQQAADAAAQKPKRDFVFTGRVVRRVEKDDVEAGHPDCMAQVGLCSGGRDSRFDRRPTPARQICTQDLESSGSALDADTRARLRG